ncbi:luciferin 4-monooxygenase-like [Anopheles albimanus]|uniref:AMP-dependent synthetase/ligase domain-containing protein n=1 Tax=Anopheles albimanus TaxID=7167 RepID=A0A182FJP6_ANOAL|nr:luciferin 4-monooxygenase-like [Anopheles albimanus]
MQAPAASTSSSSSNSSDEQRVGGSYDPDGRIWSGPRTPRTLDVKQSLGQLVLSSLRTADPAHVTQISSDGHGEVRVTCSEMYERTVRCAQHLTELGYGPGTMAALAASNTVHVAPVMFACFTLGITVNTLDSSFEIAEFRHMLGITRPVLVFCQRSIAEKARAGARAAGLEPRLVVFGGAADELDYLRVEQLLEPTGQEHLFVPPTLEDPGSQLAVILCSSGTTGLSKGVSYTHSFCIANMPSLWAIEPTDRILAFSSLYWLSGFAVLLLGTIHRATRIITTEGFGAERALALLARHRVTMVFFPPFHLNLLLSEPHFASTDLSALRMILCGGARVSGDLYRRLRSALPATTAIRIGYGMSESSLVTLTDPDVPYRDDTVGMLQPHTDAQIIDPDSGRAMGVNEPGEVMLRVQYPFAGYYGDPGATRATISTDGWIRTGDIGYFDDAGQLYIIDRRKDIIKYAGYQISPTELEAIIKQLPGVLECCVVGLPAASGNELPAVAIIRSPGATTGEAAPVLTESIVAQFVQERVSDSKRLRGGVFFVETLPLTPSGKVIRRKCLEQVVALRAGTRLSG